MNRNIPDKLFINPSKCSRNNRIA